MAPCHNLYHVYIYLVYARMSIVRYGCVPILNSRVQSPFYAHIYPPMTLSSLLIILDLHLGVMTSSITTYSRSGTGKKHCTVCLSLYMDGLRLLEWPRAMAPDFLDPLRPYVNCLHPPLSLLLIHSTLHSLFSLSIHILTDFHPMPHTLHQNGGLHRALATTTSGVLSSVPGVIDTYCRPNPWAPAVLTPRTSLGNQLQGPACTAGREPEV